LDVWHEEAWLPPEQVRAGKVTLALKAWSGVLGVPDRRRFKVAQLHWIDEPTESFYYLADTLLKAVKVMDENDLRRVRLLEALNAAFLRLDFTRPQSEAFYESVCAAEKFLWGEVCKWQGVEEIKPTVVGIGHAHIDLAWLWRLRHSREKAARTFATALHLMRQYPDYRFMHSSPQLYEYLKHDYPEIFARVKERIASREWEITGGMWIESDTNIPNGESLIRQFLLGRQSMRDEFGVEMNLLWLPDVFGYSYALPQIVKKCGLKYFMTTKMSWNQFNHLPYDTFRWRGVDGTELLTHFVTTPEENNPRWHTYNGQLRPSDVKGLWDNYQQKEVNDELLMLFGWGDGGGGPTKEMLEYARALKNLPGLPRVALGLAEPYFERLAQRVADKPLPVWDGELYFEYHRGTYTSQAYNKRANRLAEVLYHNAEWLSALAGVLASFNYPAQKLRQGWELILLNQFHDILPGSSIRSVYEDSQVDYEQIMQIGQSVLAEARQALLNQIGVGDESVVVFNSLSWTRDDLIELPGSGALAAQPSMQRLENGMALVLVSDLPALGYRALSLSDFSSRPGSLPAGEGAR
ncbi:MAG: alpha-mannosidase, partial [Anaerolineales bacterium]